MATQPKKKRHGYTLPETNIAPKNGGFQYKSRVFQPSIFRCYVSFRDGTTCWGALEKTLFLLQPPQTIRGLVLIGFSPWDFWDLGIPYQETQQALRWFGS